ncbi:D(1C) dopamine receptor-like [Mustelus asterias]
MPWKAAAEVAGFWPFGGFCDVWVAFDIMCSTASILNLCIISVERYWAFAGPFRYETRMTQPVAFVMIGVAWLLSVLISFIPVQLSWHKSGQALHPANASEPAQGDCDSSLNRTYAVSSSLISFYIPVAIMVATYTRIYRIAQRQIWCISSLERAVGHAQSCQGHPCGHEASLKTSFRKETQVLKTLSIIMGVFVFCWLPFFVLNCLVPFCATGARPPCVGETTFRIFVWFGWTNSALNPIIYAFNGEFRRAFATILGCHKWCANDHVEAVNFSNELASYHPDTTFQKDASTLSYPHLLPHAIQEVDDDWAFDKVSQISRTSRDTVLPCAAAVIHVECEPEISLGKIVPFTPSGLA